MDGGGSALGGLLPFLLIAVAFWFLILRPQRSRARQAAQVRDSLTVGAEVVTTAGMFARVAAVEDDVVELEVAAGVTARFVKAAIARVVTPAEPSGDDLGPADPTDLPPGS